MTSKISILGCGWLGQSLGISLINDGYLVNGSTRSKEKLIKLKSIGIKPFIVDISKPINPSFLDSDLLIISITSKSILTFESLITQIEFSKTKKVLFISSTSVYKNANSIITEETETNESLLSSIEKLFISNINFQTTILRFGGLFGPDRKAGNFIKTPKKIKNPEGFINLIHIDDCIGIIKKIIEMDIWNEIFNAAANDHPKRKYFYTQEILKTQGVKPQIDETSINSYKIISSEKLKKILNYKFIVDTLMDS